MKSSTNVIKASEYFSVCDDQALNESVVGSGIPLSDQLNSGLSSAEAGQESSDDRVGRAKPFFPAVSEQKKNRVHKTSPTLIKASGVAMQTDYKNPVEDYLPDKFISLAGADLRQETGELDEGSNLEAQVNEILQVARMQAEEIRDQSRLEGLESANAEASHQLQAAIAVLNEVWEWRQAMLNKSENDVLDLVIAIGRKIFGEGLDLSTEILQTTFSKALSEAKPLGDLRLHLNPNDLIKLEPNWQQEQSMLVAQRIDLVPDESISAGGCLIEGEFGSVDASVETQLDQIENGLRINGLEARETL